MWVMPETGAVHRDELIDLPLEAVEEEALHAAQIAQALLADIGDEGDGAGGCHAAVIEGADDRQHDRKTAAIVADAGAFQDLALAGDFDVGAFREDGVEVGGEYQVRPRGLAGPDADHVAGRVDAYVAQAKFLKQALQFLPANRLLEGRRRNFAEPDLQVDGARLIALRGFHGGAHGGVIAQFGRRLGQANSRRDEQQSRSKRHDSECHKPPTRNITRWGIYFFGGLIMM